MKESSALGVAWDAWITLRRGQAAIANHQQTRLRELVAYAREHSRYYAEKYRDVPSDIDDVRQLPPVAKPELMERFDDWATDPAVHRADVEAFVADKSLVGENFLGRYVIFTTSGSSGVPAILIQDGPAQAVMTGLTYVRGLGSVSLREYWRVFRQGGRQAAIFATGGHFLGVTMIERRRRGSPRRMKMSRLISVLTPLPDIVRELNAFQPAMVGGYATVLTLLADEQAAGRLQIHPVLMTSSGETLLPQQREQVERAFGCSLTESYGCSEATPLTLTCRHQRLHVNSDWFILEAVDESYQSVPPGELSHTVLITNLANHVQPILRYELGDSITEYADPCPCGSPLPSVSVVGRTDEILCFQASNGAAVRVLPLALWSVIKETEGLSRFQAIQTAPAKLVLRLEVKPSHDADTVWRALVPRVHSFLATQRLGNVLIERSAQAPQRDPRSGKYRHVWADLRSQEQLPNREPIQEGMVSS